MAQEEPQSYQQFRKDMEEAGYEIKEYRGRYFYRGPAVFTNEREGPTLQDVIRATNVRLQWDHLAFDWVVYPNV